MIPQGGKSHPPVFPSPCFFVFSLFCFSVLLFSSAPPGLGLEDRYVRIAILKDADTFSLKIKGSFQIWDIQGGRLIYNGKNLKEQRVNAKAGKIYLPDKSIKPAPLRLIPAKGYIHINGRAFRGKINILIKDNNKFLIINELDIEDYIKGILCLEISAAWPIDALKAQAVIARTYALYQRQFTRQKDFDLTNDIYSQVYGGRDSERWAGNRAVELTRGQVLTFEGKLFPAYYHATCSGHTEDSSQLWKIDIAALKGVACGFCAQSPHYSWEINMDVKDVRTRLIDKGYPCPIIDNIEIGGVNKSGRITFLRIKGENRILEISAKDFREAIGPNIIRSTNFTVEINSPELHFKGLGWGHGVGLCQWGMRHMAEEGYSYQDILKYYFPKTGLKLY